MRVTSNTQLNPGNTNTNNSATKASQQHNGNNNNNYMMYAGAMNSDSQLIGLNGLSNGVGVTGIQNNSKETSFADYLRAQRRSQPYDEGFSNARLESNDFVLSASGTHTEPRRGTINSNSNYGSVDRKHNQIKNLQRMVDESMFCDNELLRLDKYPSAFETNT